MCVCGVLVCTALSLMSVYRKTAGFLICLASDDLLAEVSLSSVKTNVTVMDIIKASFTPVFETRKCERKHDQALDC